MQQKDWFLIFDSRTLERFISIPTRNSRIISATFHPLFRLYRVCFYKKIFQMLVLLYQFNHQRFIYIDYAVHVILGYWIFSLSAILRFKGWFTHATPGRAWCVLCLYENVPRRSDRTRPGVTWVIPNSMFRLIILCPLRMYLK